MTADWRARVLAMPGYRAELDLVAIGPDGRLVGYCVCWVDPTGRQAQIEPLGVDPDFQRRGVSGALIAELTRRLRGYGVRELLVETESQRLPAIRAYQAAGFQPRHRSLRKGRWFSPPAAPTPHVDGRQLLA
jgi:ribosomal protein S18 acetylase RimI-like enzyme